MWKSRGHELIETQPKQPYGHYLLMLVSHPRPAWNFASRIKLVIVPIFATAYAHI